MTFLCGSARQVTLNLLHLYLFFSIYSVELELHDRKVYLRTYVSV
jgi:hypothetical protein